MMEKYFRYLDELRASGVTNMFGAGRYLEVEFNISEVQAKEVLGKWMKTFGNGSLSLQERLQKATDPRRLE